MKQVPRYMLFTVILLSLVLVGAAAAADTLPPKETPPVVETDNPETDADQPATKHAPCANWPGPDGFGYIGEGTVYYWVEISGSGTPVYLGDDEYIGPLPIGFNFLFYDVSYSEFFISSNGFISFDGGISALTNQCPLPDATYPDNLIAMMWDDLDPGDTSDPVYYQSFASCPIGSGPCLVVQYEDFCHYPGGAACTIAGTWETILYADSGDILIQFEDSGAETGSGSTTGIEGGSPASDHGLTFVCNTAGAIPDGLAIKYLFPNGLFLSPAELTKEGCDKSDITYTLTLNNFTGSAATFDLEYESSWLISGPSQLYAANNANVDFNVTIHVPCNYTDDTATVTVSGNGYSDSSILTTSHSDGGPQQWESLPPINGDGRSRPAGAAVNGKIYVIGGQTLLGRANTVEEYNPSTGLWTTKAGLMPTPASNICAAVIGTDIFIPGGYDASANYLSTLQVYHTATDTWETVVTDPLPEPKAGLGCAAMDNKLYAFGGASSGGIYTNTAYVYDPTAAAGSRWTSLSSMNYTRSYPAGITVNGKIYAIGGLNSTNDDLAYAEAFDPADGLWHIVTNLNTPRGGPGAFFWQETLIVCGGGWNTYLASCEAYDTTQGYFGVWEDLPQGMIDVRRTYAYASLPDGLYAVAGYDGNYMNLAERLVILNCVACLPPSIAISPVSLQASQPPNRITASEIEVCNAGEYPLEWFLIESLNLDYGPHQPAMTLPGTVHVDSSQIDMAIPFEGFVKQVEPGLEGSAGSSGFADPEAVLWDNGPLVTHPAACTGMDSSVLQTALGMNTIGLGIQVDSGYHVADEFTITPPNVWNIQQVKFFSYQTNAPQGPSPFVGAYYQIWNGPPNDPTSQVVFGDLVTNRLVSSTFSNVLRALDTSMCNTDRYIFVITASAGVSLPPGTYWIDWMLDGDSSYSGPWAPPITILGQPTTGNAMHYILGWNPAIDTGTGTQQGIPFVIEGTVLTSNIPWLSEDPTTGVTLGGACSNVDVSFDSTGLAFGAYFGELFAYSNDAADPSISMPVSLTVKNYQSFLPITRR